MSECGHGVLIASGEARGLCPLCQRAEIERLQKALTTIVEGEDMSELREIIKQLRADNNRQGLDAHLDAAIEENMRLRAEIERLRAPRAGGEMKDTETLDRLYLEWSQFTRAKTKREIALERAMLDIFDATDPTDARSPREILDKVGKTARRALEGK